MFNYKALQKTIFIGDYYGTKREIKTLKEPKDSEKTLSLESEKKKFGVLIIRQDYQG